MNLRQIEVFRAVMLAGSVTAGAGVLNVSPPAVSRLLSHLELRLGVRLFERRGPRLHPAPDAQALMREIEQAWRHIDRVRQAAGALRHGGGAPLRVASNLSTALELVPRAAARLRSRLPGVALSIQVATLAAMREGLESGAYDLGVGAFIDIEAGALRRQVIGSGALVAVLPADHALAGRAVLTLQGLRGEDVIAYGLGGSHGQQLEALLQRSGAPTIEVPYAYMACALVASGQGVALVDDLTLRHFQGAPVVARPLEPALAYTLEVLTDPRRPAPAAAAAMTRALQASWQALSAVPGPARPPRRPRPLPSG